MKSILGMYLNISILNKMSGFLYFKSNEWNVYVLCEMTTIRMITMGTIFGDLSPSPG